MAGSSGIRDMTAGHISELLFKYYVPLLLGNTCQQLYGVVDSIVVGKVVGEGALASIGIAQPFLFMSFGFLLGLTAGISYVTARAFGEGNWEKVRASVTISLLICAIITIIITFLTIAVSYPVLRLVKTPGKLLEDTQKYLVIIAGGYMVTMLFNFFARTLEALGDSRTPFAAVVISSGVNVALDILFVFGFRWGVIGVGVATVLAQGVGAGYELLALRRIHELRPERKDFIADRRQLGQLIGNGVPVGLMNSVTALGFIAVQFFVNQMGDTLISAYSACVRLFIFFEQPGMTLGMTMGVFSGQNAGAGNYSRVRRGVKVGLCFAAGLGAALGILEFFVPELLLSTMLTNPETISAGVQYMRCGGLCLWILNCMFVFRFSCQGMGYAAVPMVSGFVELAARVLVIGVIGTRLALLGVGLSEISAWTCAAVMLGIYYLHVIRRLRLQKPC